MNKIISRKKSRKYLFQKLFSLSYNYNEKNDFDYSFLIDSYKWKIDEEYLTEIEKIILEKQSEFIYILKKYASKFSVEKMDITYVIPIFIALSEIFYFSEEIPIKVIINEAVELAKTFWTETAPKIVNWVLDKVIKSYKQLKEEIKNAPKSEFSFFEKEIDK